jgi:radical SAM superfamily enzyme YgiQ (UPF0313 family)
MELELMAFDIAILYHPKPYLVDPDAQAGLGLLYLAAVARKLGAIVQAIDAQSKTVDEAVEAVDAPVVLLSGCQIDGPVLIDIGRRLRERDVYVAVGGPVADNPTPALVDAVNLVVRGPGEPVIESLFPPLDRGWESIDEQQDFGKWPPPARDLLPRLGGNIYHPKTGVSCEESAGLITSRGCIHRCAFCRQGGCKTYHEYPERRLRAELQEIVDRGIHSFAVNANRVYRLCDVLREFGVHWRASVRTRRYDVSLYHRMRKSGCIELNIGIESADETVLRVLRKRATVDAGHMAVSLAVGAGIHVRAMFMMGTPGETPHTLALNKAWVEHHPEATICLTAFRPFPGTAIYDRPADFGCRLELSDDPNFYSWRPDGEPEANISMIGGMSRGELTVSLREFRKFLEQRGQLNHG